MSECRICFNSGEEPLIAPCRCDGSIKWVHPACLEQWVLERYRQRYKELLRQSNNSSGISCELCKFEFWGQTKYLQGIKLLRVLLKSQSACYLALNLPVLGFLIYKFMRVTSILLKSTRSEFLLLTQQTNFLFIFIRLLKFTARLILNLFPFAVFGTALPVIMFSNVVLLRDLYAECRTFEISSIHLS